MTEETRMISTTHFHPNFPPCPDQGFVLEWAEADALATDPAQPVFQSLRLRSGSGTMLPMGALVCRDGANGLLAGGCAVAFPPADDTPSPRYMPHPVLGEWISALRYTRCLWMEAGLPVVCPGFSEERVLDALWTGLERLMKRNGMTFLMGAAPDSSAALQRALRQRARTLESASAGAMRYFVYAV
jgi:hypothetical protein